MNCPVLLYLTAENRHPLLTQISDGSMLIFETFLLLPKKKPVPAIVSPDAYQIFWSLIRQLFFNASRRSNEIIIFS